MKNAVLALLCGSLLAVGGCNALSPEAISALSKDDASICIASDIRGGALGAMTGATGGYGQSTQVLCRSKMADAQIEAKPDGSVIIRHGSGVVQP